jgi:hypothetical protein
MLSSSWNNNIDAIVWLDDNIDAISLLDDNIPNKTFGNLAG